MQSVWAQNFVDLTIYTYILNFFRFFIRYTFLNAYQISKHLLQYIVYLVFALKYKFDFFSILLKIEYNRKIAVSVSFIISAKIT